MTAPTLTPLDSAIFDEDVIADLERNGDEEPQCQCIEDEVFCTARADFVSVCNLCGHQSALMCTDHAQDLPNVTRVMTHIRCGGKARLCDLLRVVPL